MTMIKICGLRRMEDVRAVNAARPDYAGFIVEFPKSHRSVGIEELRDLTDELDGRIIPVGVFVNAPLELPAMLLNEGTIMMAQLHGQESEEYVRELKRQIGYKQVIKAFSVKTKEDLELAKRSPADYILLDQGDGGTGKTFDWSLMETMEREYFLAGGLNAGNLAEAIRRFHPYAVDLSSSLEIEKYKDAGLIRQAVEIVRMEE